MYTDNLSKTDTFPNRYREVKIGNTLYCVTSEFRGEKELGPTLEKLAVQRILEEMSHTATELFHN